MPTARSAIHLRVTRRTVLGAAAGAAAAAVSPAAATPRPQDASLYIISPNDGERMHGPFWCRFGLRNMGVAPAGMEAHNAGHHHLLIDVTEPLVAGEPIPADAKHIHFGAGQTEVRLDLPRGHHTLQLALGDANHVPFDPPLVSRKVHVIVV